MLVSTIDYSPYLGGWPPAASSVDNPVVLLEHGHEDAFVPASARTKMSKL